ncbi:MAG: serine hydrolase [Gemmatimonadaceae bacterium]
MKNALWSIALVLAPSAAVAQASPFDGLDAYITKSMKDWEVPGVAIAIVRGDSMIYAKGYGVRTLGKTDPVTERTMFAIGSSSKAFTGVAVAMLVDEGKINWNDPVTQHLTGFQLHDAAVTRDLRVRDLLSHRSGLARGDLVWYGSAYDRNEILRRVRYLRPTWGLRSNFGYQNIMYLAAGQVVAQVSGKSWDDFVRERIFTPLGMTSSNTSVTALTGMTDVASPQNKIDDTLRVVSYRNIDNIGPAGSINSNVIDMAKWIRFQLDSGKVAGKTVLSTSSFLETHAPHTIIRNEGPSRAVNPFTHFQTYGLGWFLEDYRGREVVHHGGNIDGMSALVGMLPEEDVGVVILSNAGGSPLPGVIMRKVFDMHLKAPPRDWSAEVMKIVKPLQAQAKATEKKQEDSRVKGTKPSLALDKYAGTYLDSLYGEMKLKLEKGNLVMSSGPAFTADLEHWHYDTFRAKWRDRSLGKTMVTFSLNAGGNVVGFRPEGGPGAVAEETPDYKRIAEPADTSKVAQLAEADLKKFVGDWESKAPPITVSVELIAGTLKLTVPGQPLYTLEPVTPTRFRLTGPPGLPPGFFVQFDSAATMTLEQPAPQPTMKFVKKG